MTVPKLLATADIRQTRDHDCGLAVFRCVCQYWKVPTLRITTDPHDGLHPFELEPAFRRAGLWVFSGSMNLDDLRHNQRHGRPVAALIRIPGGGHWVVVRGLTRSRVHYQCPSDGPGSMRFPLWEAVWQDTDRNGTLFRRHGIATWI